MVCKVRPAAVQLMQPGEQVLLELLVVAGQGLHGSDLGIDVGGGADPGGRPGLGMLGGRGVDQEPAPTTGGGSDAALEAGPFMADAHPRRDGTVPGEIVVVAAIGMQQRGEVASDQRIRGLADERQQRLVRPFDDSIGAHQPSRARDHPCGSLKVRVDRLDLSPGRKFYQDRPSSRGRPAGASRRASHGRRMGTSRCRPQGRDRRGAPRSSCGLGVPAHPM